MARILQYLRRSNIISVDWHKRTIKRESALEDYVKHSIMTSPNWSSTGEDWRKINDILRSKHGEVNTEYQDKLPKQ